LVGVWDRQWFSSVLCECLSLGRLGVDLVTASSPRPRPSTPIMAEYGTGVDGARCSSGDDDPDPRPSSAILVRRTPS
jgi:hypothetical protein